VTMQYCISTKKEAGGSPGYFSLVIDFDG